MPKVFEGKSSKIYYISGMFLTFSSSTILKAGNTRIQFSDLDGDGQISLNAQDGEVMQVLAYYPFGMTIEGLNPADLSDPAYRYRYNGKEEEPNSRMYDYGARWYMPDIGRWGVVDPLGELGYNSATYSYGFNNPIRYLDPDGMWAQDADGNWSTDDPEEIRDFHNSLLNASKTGGSIQIVDHEDQDGNAFAIFSIGNNGAYHRAFHSSNTGTGFGVQALSKAGDNILMRQKNEMHRFSQRVNSVTFSWVFAGGASYTLGNVQDKYGNRRWFSTVGGGVGAEFGVSFNHGRIKENEGYNFNVKDFNGIGFQYSYGIGPFGRTRSGDTEKHGFYSNGTNYTVIGGFIGERRTSKTMRILTKLNFKVGGSYQWTKTY